jgi:hypothetical protein
MSAHALLPLAVSNEYERKLIYCHCWASNPHLCNCSAKFVIDEKEEDDAAAADDE